MTAKNPDQYKIYSPFISLGLEGFCARQNFCEIGIN